MECLNSGSSPWRPGVSSVPEGQCKGQEWARTMLPRCRRSPHFVASSKDLGDKPLGHLSTGPETASFCVLAQSLSIWLSSSGSVAITASASGSLLWNQNGSRWTPTCRPRWTPTCKPTADQEQHLASFPHHQRKSSFLVSCSSATSEYMSPWTLKFQGSLTCYFFFLSLSA